MALQCLLPVSFLSMRNTTSVKIGNSDYFLFPGGFLVACWGAGRFPFALLSFFPGPVLSHTLLSCMSPHLTLSLSQELWGQVPNSWLPNVLTKFWNQDQWPQSDHMDKLCKGLCQFWINKCPSSQYSQVHTEHNMRMWLAQPPHTCTSIYYAFIFICLLQKCETKSMHSAIFSL